MVKKRLFAALLILALIAALTVGCEGKDKTKIVYLGDSIAEGVLGPSPLSGREDFAYYAVVGKISNYQFKNRSVSGHMTKDLLAYLNKTEEDARLVLSTIKEADIIHLSILGNDFLANNVGKLVIASVNGDYTKIDQIVAGSAELFASVIARLKEINPDGQLLINTVYNPTYPGSEIIDAPSRETLAEMEVDQNDFRSLAGPLLARLNGIIYDYLEEHPGAYQIVDAKAAFDSVFDSSAKKGERLIYPDGIHPSDYGHAVIGDALEAKLVELGLADGKKALKNYKNLSIERLKKYYKNSVDVKAVSKQIKSAASFSEVTDIFFAAVADKPMEYV
jgi:Lysophospholipase L1 and related esterases